MVFQEYQDPKVGKYLKYGYWYQAHRGLLHNWERNVLIILLAVIWLIFAWFVFNFVLAQGQYNQLMKDLTGSSIDILAVQKARAPGAPQIGAVSILSGENQTRADFMAIAENTNQNWQVALDYIFVWADGQTTSESAFILPQSKAILATRGVTVNSLPAAAELQITGQHWQRLRTAAEKERALVAKNGIIIDSPAAVNDDSAATAFYKVKNQSIYDWLAARFIVVLYQGDTPIAMGVNEVPELLSGTEQTIEYRWLQSLPTGLTAEVSPVLNPFDESAYRLPSGGDYAL